MGEHRISTVTPARTAFPFAILTNAAVTTAWLGGYIVVGLRGASQFVYRQKQTCRLYFQACSSKSAFPSQVNTVSLSLIRVFWGFNSYREFELAQR